MIYGNIRTKINKFFLQLSRISSILRFSSCFKGFNNFIFWLHKKYIIFFLNFLSIFASNHRLDLSVMHKLKFALLCWTIFQPASFLIGNTIDVSDEVNAWISKESNSRFKTLILSILVLMTVQMILCRTEFTFGCAYLEKKKSDESIRSEKNFIWVWKRCQLLVLGYLASKETM